jgi:hypothetical protein
MSQTTPEQLATVVVWVLVRVTQATATCYFLCDMSSSYGSSQVAGAIFIFLFFGPPIAYPNFDNDNIHYGME